MLKRICAAIFACVPLLASASDLPVSTDLVYGSGSVQVNANLDSYDNISANTLSKGNVMITYPSTMGIDRYSFRMGSKPLPVTFVSSTQVSPYGDILVAIYNFTLEGMPEGTHTLPAITVKVGGKEYAALPLVVVVGK